MENEVTPRERLYLLAGERGILAQVQAHDAGQNVFLSLGGGLNKTFGSYWGDALDATEQAIEWLVTK